MSDETGPLQKLKPAVRRRTLLLGAGCAWTVGGLMLLMRGLTGLASLRAPVTLDIGLGLAGGLLFYLALFARISGKHISRITLIQVDNPCFFSFFNVRSYLMMAAMIGGGITLRRLDIVNHQALFTFYLMMGLPLLISAYRFFYSWARNRA